MRLFMILNIMNLEEKEVEDLKKYLEIRAKYIFEVNGKILGYLSGGVLVEVEGLEKGSVVTITLNGGVGVVMKTARELANAFQNRMMIAHYEVR